jgi:ATP/maltotriose-dependent transcriptional regulator MalT
MSEALEMNIEAMERAHEIVKFDQQTLGFDIDVWLTVMRGQTLVMLGRGGEARPFLDRILQLESGLVDTLHHVIPSLAYVDLAWAEGNIRLAQEHADRAFSLAITGGNPYLRVYAQACRGVSHTIAGRLTSAIEDLSGALDFARSRKVGLENESRILADLANAYRLNGDAVTALTTVDDAIKVATERHTRVPECLSRIVRADLLLRSAKGDRTAEGRQELDRAKALMRETGVVFFANFINATDGEDGNSHQISTKARR